MESRRTKLYDRHQRIVFATTILVFNITISALALTYLGLLFRAPHRRVPSTMVMYDERSVKSGHVVLLILPPLAAIVVATVDIIFYYKRSLSLVYVVVMTSVFVLSWPAVASLWMICHYNVAYGNNDPPFCYTSYLQAKSDYNIIGLPAAPLIVAVALIVLVWITYILYLTSAASDLRDHRHSRRQVNPDIVLESQSVNNGSHKSKASVEVH